MAGHITLVNGEILNFWTVTPKVLPMAVKQIELTGDELVRGMASWGNARLCRNFQESSDQVWVWTGAQARRMYQQLIESERVDEALSSVSEFYTNDFGGERKRLTKMEAFELLLETKSIIIKTGDIEAPVALRNVSL